MFNETIKKVLKVSKIRFKDNLVAIVLGGSCGKNNPIISYSDIDIYVILKTYNVYQVKNFSKIIEDYNIHVGITYYTLMELEYDMIDNKTKIMIYEKQNYNVNPTIYGFCSFHKIPYSIIVLNDKTI